MSDINNMNMIADGPIDRLIDAADHLLVILCDVILDIDDYQGFFCIVLPPDRSVDSFTISLYSTIDDNSPVRSTSGVAAALKSCRSIRSTKKFFQLWGPVRVLGALACSRRNKAQNT